MEWYRLGEMDNYPVPDEWQLFPYINNTTTYEYSETMVWFYLSNRMRQSYIPYCFQDAFVTYTNTDFCRLCTSVFNEKEQKL
jgi:hypothetical protein